MAATSARWLSAWIANNEGDLGAVVEGLNKDLTDSNDAKRDPESEPIRHLRRYSNYLTPKLGFFSSDTWTLVATVLRNIFLNWLMLIPILALALMLPRLLASFALGRGAELWLVISVRWRESFAWSVAHGLFRARPPLLAGAERPRQRKIAQNDGGEISLALLCRS